MRIGSVEFEKKGRVAVLTLDEPSKLNAISLGIRQGVATALLVVFIPMLGSYVVPDMVGGTGTQMIGNKIAQRNFTDRNLPEAAALSGALVLLVLAPMFLRRREKPAAA